MPTQLSAMEQKILRDGIAIKRTPELKMKEIGRIKAKYGIVFTLPGV